MLTFDTVQRSNHVYADAALGRSQKSLSGRRFNNRVVCCADAGAVTSDEVHISDNELMTGASTQPVNVSNTASWECASSENSAVDTSCICSSRYIPRRYNVQMPICNFPRHSTFKSVTKLH